MTPIIPLAIILAFVAVILTLGFLLTRCTHSWQLVDKTELPPPIEVAQKNGGRPLYFDSTVESMSKRTLIMLIRCDKCGRVKIFRERG